VVGQHRGPLRGAVHLRVEPVPVAAHDHQHQGDAHGGDRAREAHPPQRHRSADVEPDHGRGHDGAPAPAGHHRVHAALVRGGPGGERQVKGLLLMGLALGGLCAVLGAVSATAADTIAPLFAAHRGGAALWPENSLLAFRNALALGADYLEMDVHLSRDGEVMVMHDPTLDRTSTGSGPVRALTEEPVPTLERVVALAAAAKRQMLVEIKTDEQRRRYPGIEEKVLAILDRHRFAPSAIVMSFEGDTWRRVRQLRPDVRAGA